MGAAIGRPILDDIGPTHIFLGSELATIAMAACAATVWVLRAPMPDRLEPHDDLAELVVRFEVAVGFNDVIEVEDRVDGRVDSAGP